MRREVSLNPAVMTRMERKKFNAIFNAKFKKREPSKKVIRFGRGTHQKSD